MLEIEVGDRVTYKYKEGCEIFTRIIETNGDIKITLEDDKEILKIERPTYTVVKEKKELLTKREKEFLEIFVKYYKDLYYIEFFNECIDLLDVNYMSKGTIDYPTYLDFRGIKKKRYRLSELGLAKEYCECCGSELTKENKALGNMCNECKYGLEE